MSNLKKLVRRTTETLPDLGYNLSSDSTRGLTNLDSLNSTRTLPMNIRPRVPGHFCICLGPKMA